MKLKRSILSLSRSFHSQRTKRMNVVLHICVCVFAVDKMKYFSFIFSLNNIICHFLIDYKSNPFCKYIYVCV